MARGRLCVCSDVLVIRDSLVKYLELGGIGSALDMVSLPGEGVVYQNGWQRTLMLSIDLS